MPIVLVLSNYQRQTTLKNQWLLVFKLRKNMKKAVLMVMCLCVATLPAFAQWSFRDYQDGKTFSTDSVTYVIENLIERSLLEGGLASRLDEVLEDASKTELYVSLKNKKNFRTGGSQYADGTPVVYSEYASEVAGIIVPKEEYKPVLYRAVRSAFSKEEELVPYKNKIIIIYVVVDNKGNILETSTGFPIWKDHVFQPEQIATLESLIRKNLKFEVSPKAKNFNYFEGQIIIPFGRYIEDMSEIKIKEGAKAFDGRIDS